MTNQKDEYCRKLEEMLIGIAANIVVINNILLHEKSGEVISSKKEAAKFIGCSEQTITTLLEEGRISNYGRGRIFIFHKSELLDIRKVSHEEN